MKSTHHVQQRPQNQDERLRAFVDPAFCRITKENGNADYGTTAAAFRDLSWRAISRGSSNRSLGSFRQAESSSRKDLSYAAFDGSSNSTLNRAPSAAATFSSVVNE